MISQHTNAPVTIQTLVGNGVLSHTITIDPVLISSRSRFWAKFIRECRVTLNGKLLISAPIGAPGSDPDVFGYYIEAVTKDKIRDEPFRTFHDPQDAANLIQKVAFDAIAFRDGKTLEVLGELVVTLGHMDVDGAAILVSTWKEAMNGMREQYLT